MSYYDMLREEQYKEEAKMSEQSSKIGRALQGQLFQGEKYIIETLKGEKKWIS